MSNDDRIPVIEEYRGVGLYAWQDNERLAAVRASIDHVHGLTNPEWLFSYSANPSNPPEARLLAAARLEAIWECAAESRTERPDIDLDKLRAATAGLASLRWLDPAAYGSLLESGARRRDVPIPDAEIEALIGP